MENVARFEGRSRFRLSRGLILLVALAVVVIVWALNVSDWHQLWSIASAPDNIPNDPKRDAVPQIGGGQWKS